MENTEKTLSEVTAELTKKGYDANIRILDKNHLKMNQKTFTKNEVTIEKVYRFEGMSNPSDTSICYAIKSDTGEKGILINAYGADASDTIGAFIHDVKKEK
ncbi:MAG: phosphoribosylpyrophosphate synthetase [Vicingaceae bacterium]